MKERDEMKFNIGDKVWYTHMKWVEQTTTCPDCMGTRALTVIMGDGSQVSIDCVGCASGFDPPRGYIRYTKYAPIVVEVIINKVEITSNGIEYGHSKNHYCTEDKLFSTKEAAEKRAVELAEIYNKEELEKISKKEKPARTWAWNAHYHRQQIKRAEKDLAYHTAKLSVAKVKAKEREG